MQYRLSKRLSICLLFIVPPIIFACIHIHEVTFVKEINVSNQKIEKLEISKDIPPVEFQEGDNEVNFNKNIFLEDFEKWLDELSRSVNFPDIPLDVIRHKLTVSHDISTDVPYTEIGDYNKDNIATTTFWFTLSCDGSYIEANRKYVNKKSFQLSKLNDEGLNNEDREYVRNVLDKCIVSRVGGARNNLGRGILVHQELSNFVFSGNVNFILRPDILSQIFIFIAWYVLWFGFLILLRTGVGRYLIKIKTDNK